MRQFTITLKESQFTVKKSTAIKCAKWTTIYYKYKDAECRHWHTHTFLQDWQMCES